MFRLLSLAYPGESYSRIYRGLSSARLETRTDSVELLDNVLPASLRQPVLGLVDDRPDENRLSAAGSYHQPRRFDYDEVLEELLDSASKTVQSMAVYHIGELRLVRFQARIEALEGDESTLPDISRTLAILSASESTAALGVADAG